MKSYALWEIQTINMIRDFDNERDALALVLRFIELNGPEVVNTLALNVEDEDGNISPIAHGQELAERARREFSRERLTS